MESYECRMKSAFLPSASLRPVMRESLLAVVLLLALLIRGGVLLLTPDALRAIPTATGGWRRTLSAHGTFGDGQTCPPPTVRRSIRCC